MRFTELTVIGVAKWRWRFATQRLRDAYDAARSSLDESICGLLKEEEKRKLETPNPSDPDELDAHENWLDNIVDRHDEAQHALATIKQGFALILYHSWEKHAVKWANWNKKYHHGKVTGILKYTGYVIAPDVHKLNKVANCIKHGSAELWNTDPTMFNDHVHMAVQQGLKPDYAHNILLNDAHMNDFFDALIASGPPGPATPSI